MAAFSLLIDLPLAFLSESSIVTRDFDLQHFTVERFGQIYQLSGLLC